MALGMLMWASGGALTAGSELVPRPVQLTLTGKTSSTASLSWSAGNVSEKSNALLATPQGGVEQVQPLVVRTQFHALVLNYDAHILANGALVRASDYYGWRDVGKLTREYIELLRRASGGQTVWSVEERFDLDEFAPSTTPSQTVFDSTNYLALRAQNYSYRVSYDALIHDPRFGIVQKVNSRKVDAVWVFGMPNVDFWETAMAGPDPYWVNGSPIPDSSLSRNIVFYGFGKEPHQGVGFMCENTCHMTENILGRISANWPRTVSTRVFQALSLNDPNRVLTNKLVNDWTHFTQAEAASWDPMLVAPGNAQVGLSHYPPTALYNYDWSTISQDFSGTEPFQACDGDWSILNGEYRVLAANSAKVLAMDGINPQAFSDADVEFTVRVMNNSWPSYAGLMFRLSSCKSGPNQATGYYAAIDAYENRVILAKLQNQFISLTNAPYALRTNFAHHLRVEARGSQIRVFLDGNLTPLISVNDESYVTGGFGFSAYFTDAFFDNLTIVPHVASTADKWYHYPATSAPVRDLTPLEWNGEGAPAMDGFYAWWWEHLPKNGGVHYVSDLENGSTAQLLNTWWPYVFDINVFTNTCPAADIVFPPEDVSAPATPSEAVALAQGASRIGVYWSEPEDDVGVTRYEVSRNGVLLRKTPLNYLIDTQLAPNARYTYEIKACDGSDNASGVAQVSATTLGTDKPGQILNGEFEFLPQISGWGTDGFSAGTAQFAWEPAGCGRRGGRCISIEASEFSDASWVQTVSGLIPGEVYWLTGWIRGQDIVREPNRDTGANICLEGTWTHAPDYLDGTFDWQQASFSFVAPASGTVTVGCRLGYWSNTTRGKVWFDDVAIVQATELQFDRIECVSESWLRLVLRTPPGHRYRIERSADFVTWSEVQTLNVVHPVTEVQDALSKGSKCFYRARQVDVY